jgi:hypothetical protein
MRARALLFAFTFLVAAMVPNALVASPVVIGPIAHGGCAGQNQFDVAASPSNVLANGTATSTITVTVKRCNTANAGAVVTLQPGPGAHSVFTGANSATIDNTGIATFLVSDRTMESVTFSVTIKSYTGIYQFGSDFTIPITAQVNFVSSATTPAPTPTPKVVLAPRTLKCTHRPMDEVTDERVGQFFCFAGVNLRVDSVQTVAKVDSSPLLTKNINTQPDPDLGYIVVKVTMQNRSASSAQTYPGNWLGFDLADGSKIDLGLINAEYVGPNLNDPPNELAPGQTLQATYVVVNWNRSPITTMYIKRNVGNGENDPGVQYARFNIAGL